MPWRLRAICRARSSSPAIATPCARRWQRRSCAISRYAASSSVLPACAPGETTDPFASAVMEKLGIDMSKRKPVSLAGVHDTSFDLIVTLAPEAYYKALEIVSGIAIDVEYWPTQDPSLASGNREQILDAYRAVYDGLFTEILGRCRASLG